MKPAREHAPLRAAFVDGRFVDADAAHVSVFDPYWRAGHGVFESLVVALRSGRLHGLVEQHVARMRSASERWACGELPAVDVRAVLDELVRRAGLRQARARISLHPEGACPRLVILVEELPELAARRAAGVELVTSPFAFGPRDPSPGAKLEARGLYTAARLHALAHGADDALLESADGRVLETTRHNVFVRLGEEAWRTPPLDGAGMLPGIARQRVLDALRADGAELAEAPLPAEELRRALEAARPCAIWLTNGVVGIEPARRLDGLEIKKCDRSERQMDRCLRILRSEGMPC